MDTIRCPAQFLQAIDHSTQRNRCAFTKYTVVTIGFDDLKKYADPNCEGDINNQHSQTCWKDCLEDDCLFIRIFRMLEKLGVKV